MRNVGQARHRLWIQRIARGRDGQPQARFDMDAGRLTVGPKHICVLNLLQITYSMQIYVSLKQAAIWNISGDYFELERLHRLVELEEPILAAMKRTPNLIESASLPDPYELVDRRERVRRQLRDLSRN